MALAALNGEKYTMVPTATAPEYFNVPSLVTVALVLIRLFVIMRNLLFSVSTTPIPSAF